jgi:hypothetical protein
MNRHQVYAGWAAAGCALVGLAASAALAGSRVTVREALAPTGVEADASGRATLTLRNGAKGKFEVKVRHLAPATSFDVVVGGVKVGSIRTSRSGQGGVRFSSRARGRDLPLGFDPRGSAVTVRDGSGDDVLAGGMSDGSLDPGEVACCVPGRHEDGECEDLTPDACAAAGGTLAGVDSCLPDPCTSASGPGDGALVCCLNETGDDESESECEDTTEAGCAAAGGMVVEAVSCDPNPCTPTPAGDVTACCVPDDDTSGETDCEVLSAEACMARGGTAVAGGTCAADPCGSGDDDSGDDGSDDGGGGGGEGDD